MSKKQLPLINNFVFYSLFVWTILIPAFARNAFLLWLVILSFLISLLVVTSAIECGRYRPNFSLRNKVVAQVILAILGLGSTFWLFEEIITFRSHLPISVALRLHLSDDKCAVEKEYITDHFSGKFSSDDSTIKLTANFCSNSAEINELIRKGYK